MHNLSSHAKRACLTLVRNTLLEPHDVDGGEGQVHVARMYIISEGLLRENCSSTPCLGTDALHQVIDVFGAWAFLPKALDEAVGSCPGESKGLRHLVY